MTSLHVICGLGPPQSKILATPMPWPIIILKIFHGPTLKVLLKNLTQVFISLELDGNGFSGRKQVISKKIFQNSNVFFGRKLVTFKKKVFTKIQTVFPAENV